MGLRVFVFFFFFWGGDTTRIARAEEGDKVKGALFIWPGACDGTLEHRETSHRIDCVLPKPNMPVIFSARRQASRGHSVADGVVVTCSPSPTQPN